MAASGADLITTAGAADDAGNFEGGNLVEDPAPSAIALAVEVDALLPGAQKRPQGLPRRDEITSVNH